MSRDELKRTWIELLAGAGGKRDHLAIAIALLEVADQTAAVAAGLRMLGTNDAATQMGAIELLAMEVKKISEAIEAHTEHLRDA